MNGWLEENGILKKEVFKYEKDRSVFLTYNPQSNTASVYIGYVTLGTKRQSFLYGYSFNVVTNNIKRWAECNIDDVYPIETALWNDKATTDKNVFIADVFTKSLFFWISGDTAHITSHTLRFKKYNLFTHRNKNNRLFWVMLNDEILTSLYDIFMEYNKECLNVL